MVKTVMIDNSTHKKLEDIQRQIKDVFNTKVALGDVVDKLASGNPKEIVKRIFEIKNEGGQQEENIIVDNLSSNENDISLDEIKRKLDESVKNSSKSDLEPLNIKKIVYPELPKNEVHSKIEMSDEINDEVKSDFPLKDPFQRKEVIIKKEEQSQ